MEPKKISFGFSKVTKVNILTKKPAPVEENKVQLIEYLEGQSIKVVGGQDDKPKELLVIPMKAPNKKLINLVDIVQNNFVDKEEEPITIEQNNSTENGNTDLEAKPLSLDELAAKELLNDLKKPEPKEESQRIIEVEKEKVSLDGEKESTIEDYESIPVEDFGKAMLRGMGWKDGTGVGKNQQLVKIAQPPLRPKGMGLGADKLTKQDTNAKPAVDRDGKVLSCIKGAYVKVIAGYHKGSYGQIIGLDDESGRFIIKTALNNLNISLNEFLVMPVTKEDYNKNSKVINNAKYDEYIKKKEAEKELALKMDTQQCVKTKKEHSSSSEEEIRRNKKEDRRDSRVQEKTRMEEKKFNKRNMSSEDEGERRKHRRDDKSRLKTDNKAEERQEKRRNKREYEEERKSNKRDSSSDEEDKKRRYKREDKNRSKFDNKTEEKRRNKSEHQEEKTEEKRRNKNEHQEEKGRNKRDLSSENSKQNIKKEKSRKYSESESEASEEKYRKKVKKEELSDEEYLRSRKKEKSSSKRTTKYNSEDEKDRRRDKNREKKKHHTSSASDSEDSEEERHRRKKSKKKHKKIKKRSSEDSSDERHKKKKRETKYTSDSEQERKKSKRKKEEKERR